MKKLFYLLTLALFLIGCEPQSPSSEQEATIDYRVPMLNINGDRQVHQLCKIYKKSLDTIHQVSLTQAYDEYAKFTDHVEVLDQYTVRINKDLEAIQMNLDPAGVVIGINNNGQLDWFSSSEERGKIITYGVKRYDYDDNVIHKSFEDVTKALINLDILMTHSNSSRDITSLANQKNRLTNSMRVSQNFNQALMTQDIYSTAYLGGELEYFAISQRNKERVTEIKTLSVTELLSLRVQLYKRLKLMNFFLDNFMKTVSIADIPFYDEKEVEQVASHEPLISNEVVVADCYMGNDMGAGGDSLYYKEHAGAKLEVLGFGTECRIDISWKGYKK